MVSSKEIFFYRKRKIFQKVYKNNCITIREAYFTINTFNKNRQDKFAGRYLSTTSTEAPNSTLSPMYNHSEQTIPIKH